MVTIKTETAKSPFPLPRDHVVYLLLLAVGVLSRIPFLGRFDLIEYDGTYYVNQAQSMLKGLPEGGAYPIGYPGAIALLLPLVRDGVRAAQVVSFLAGIGSVWVLYELGKRIASRSWAFLAALVLALTPLFGRATLTSLSESLFVFLLLLGFYFFERGKSVSFGLSMGIAAITRPEGLGPFAILLFLRRRPWKRVALAAAAFLVIYAVNVAVLSLTLDRLVILPKGEGLGTTTSRWQARETWIDFSGKETFMQELQTERGANIYLDAVARYPRELLLLTRHLMPIASLLALLGMLKKRLFLLAGFFAFFFYPFFTPRSDVRYLLPYAPFALLYAAVGLDHIRSVRMRSFAAVALVLSAVAGLAVNRAQLTDRVSDGFQWAKGAGLAWRDRVEKGDEVADRKPYFAFYAGMKYVKIPIAPYDDTIEYLFDENVRFLMLHRKTIDPLRPAVTPLLHDPSVIQGELRYRQVDVGEETYILYERTGVGDPLERKRLTPRVEGIVAMPSWSPDGRSIAYRWISPSDSGAIFVLPIDGTQPQSVFESEAFNDPLAWSPDSRRVCFAHAANDDPDIFVCDLATRALDNITRHPAADRAPSWSADGNEIVFASNRSGRYEIWSKNLETGQLEQISEGGGNIHAALSPNRERIAWGREGEGLVILDRRTGRRHLVEIPKDVKFAPSWSPDGRFIAVTAGHSLGKAGIYLLTSDGRNALLLTKTHLGNGMPSWSPAGDRMAVVTNDSGDYGIWILSGLERYLERLFSPVPSQAFSSGS